MNGVLIDSDALIEVARGRASAVEQWRALVFSGELMAVSPITVAEVWRGARPSEEVALTDLFGSLNCLDLDGATARLAAVFLQRYQRSHRLELPDAFIAAAAAIHQMPLWTRNRKHFPMAEVPLYP